jgi:hypothetical protein
MFKVDMVTLAAILVLRMGGGQKGVAALEHGDPPPQPDNMALHMLKLAIEAEPSSSSAVAEDAQASEGDGVKWLAEAREVFDLRPRLRKAVTLMAPLSRSQPDLARMARQRAGDTRTASARAPDRLLFLDILLGMPEDKDVEECLMTAFLEAAAASAAVASEAAAASAAAQEAHTAEAASAAAAAAAQRGQHAPYGGGAFGHPSLSQAWGWAAPGGAAAISAAQQFSPSATHFRGSGMLGGMPQQMPPGGMGFTQQQLSAPFFGRTYVVPPPPPPPTSAEMAAAATAASAHAKLLAKQKEVLTAMGIKPEAETSSAHEARRTAVEAAVATHSSLECIAPLALSPEAYPLAPQGTQLSTQGADAALGSIAPHLLTLTNSQQRTFSQHFMSFVMSPQSIQGSDPRRVVFISGFEGSIVARFLRAWLTENKLDPFISRAELESRQDSMLLLPTDPGSAAQFAEELATRIHNASMTALKSVYTQEPLDSRGVPASLAYTALAVITNTTSATCSVQNEAYRPPLMPGLPPMPVTSFPFHHLFLIYATFLAHGYLIRCVTREMGQAINLQALLTLSYVRPSRFFQPEGKLSPPKKKPALEGSRVGGGESKSAGGGGAAAQAVEDELNKLKATLLSTQRALTAEQRKHSGPTPKPPSARKPGRGVPTRWASLTEGGSFTTAARADSSIKWSQRAHGCAFCGDVACTWGKLCKAKGNFPPAASLSGGKPYDLNRATLAVMQDKYTKWCAECDTTPP